jgi:lipoprotein-anchoring transpeptidase ErfK/SrfK
MNGLDRWNTRPVGGEDWRYQLFSHDASSSALRRVGVPIVGLALLVSACTSSGGTDSPPGSSAAAPSSSAATGASQSAASSSASSSAAAAAPVQVTATPTSRTNLSPVTPITVTAANGTLESVTLLNPEGKAVTGAYSADKASWHTTEVLGYSKTYRLSARATNSSGEGTDTLKHKFTTLTPSNMTMPYLHTIYGSSLANGATYGVGMIPVVDFDEPITDQKAAEKALQVTTSPHVDGSWYWVDDHTAHWRPQHYYQPGTTVTVDAKVYGVRVGDGLYGQADQKVSYKIGAKHVAIANAQTHHVKVYFNDKLKRTMPTSMGQGGTVKGKNGQTIYLWTMPGTYTVIGHENPATMSSDSYGLPANSPLGYAPEKVPYATKISTDGIYLHELDTTVGYQGNTNVSHGCLNLNYANASWYYKTSKVGDIVRVIHSGGPKLELWQGGDWTLSWKDWQKGSAL